MIPAGQRVDFQRSISSATPSAARRRRSVMMVTRRGRGRPVAMMRTPAGRRRRSAAKTPDPGIIIPVPAIVIDHISSVVIPVIICNRSGRHHDRSRSGRRHHRSWCGRHHDRSRSGSRRDHHSPGFHHGPDQIHDISRKTDTARPAMVMMVVVIGRRRTCNQSRCRTGEQKSSCDSSDQNVSFHDTLLMG